jgi:hypothetical protein
MTEKVHNSIKQIVEVFLTHWHDNYWSPLYHYLETNPALINTFTGFLLYPEKIIVYVGRTHIAIEYIGSEITKELKPERECEAQYQDYSIKECNLLEKIIGFKYESTSSSQLFQLDLPSFSEELIIATTEGSEKLLELGWNVDAQNGTMITGSNILPELMPNRFTRIVNGMFFDADDSGLKSRHIKWIDFFPIIYKDRDKETYSISFSLIKLKELIVPDAHYIYPMPDDYKYIQLPKINRFIEVWGNFENSETDITSHLAKIENQFILTMKFGAVDIYSELICEWQSENRDSIKPDFFVVQPNGYADIVEFKRPSIDKNFVVGSANRETFSAWLNSYISQTRVYATYFEDPNNRKWFEDKYGFKVHKPRRCLVVGRRSDFGSDVWREIMHDYKDLEIMTFDDLIDGVVVQFYKT